MNTKCQCGKCGKCGKCYGAEAVEWREVYDCPKTVISEEYSAEYHPGMEPYYPINDAKNNVLAEQYRQLALQEKDVIFGGRLAEYKYYDMAPIVEKVMAFFAKM